MRLLLFLLVPAALLSGPARYARLGEFEGKVEVQLQPWDGWSTAQRNLPVGESAWLRTSAASKAEVELDEGSAFRLGPESLAEFSDYSRLSTGQRVTLLSLDSGIAYFTGQAEGRDSLMLAVPGAQVTVRRGARVRLEATDQWSQIAVIEGSVRLSSPAAEFDLSEGQTTRVEPAHTQRFFLYREVTAIELDRWSEERDQRLAHSASGTHVPAAFGASDLDTAGDWLQTEDLGMVWKPKVSEGWVPYRAGRWQWYDTAGYTWISDDNWGWLPYHYGRWTRRPQAGWVWVPSKKAVFKPGEVYWLRGAKIAGWGPLAPGEEWSNPATQPQQFLNVNTTWAAFQQDARVIDPAGFDARPKEALGAAAFALALPSPSLPAARLDAVRPALRAGSTRITPVLAGVTYASGQPVHEQSVVTLPATAPVDPAAPVAVVTNPASDQAPVVVVQTPPPAPPQEVIYPVPVYTGIVVVNPPENDDHRHHRGPKPQPQPKPPTTTPPATPPPQPTTPGRSAVPRTEPAAESHGRPPATPAPATPTPAPQQSVAPRTEPERGDAHRRYPAPQAEQPHREQPKAQSNPAPAEKTDTDRTPSRRNQ